MKPAIKGLSKKCQHLGKDAQKSRRAFHTTPPARAYSTEYHARLHNILIKLVDSRGLYRISLLSDNISYSFEDFHIHVHQR